MTIANKLLLLGRFICIGWIGSILSISFALQVGVVDDIVVSCSSSLRALIKTSNAKVNTLEKEIEELMSQLQKLNAEFRKNEMIMDEKTRAQKEKAVIVLAKRFEAKMRVLETEKTAVKNKTEQYLQDACAKIAKEKKLNILFSTKGVVYADAELDVTKQVVNALPHSAIESTLDANSLNSSAE